MVILVLLLGLVLILAVTAVWLLELREDKRLATDFNTRLDKVMSER